jgi:RHS repeat-associated protein
MCKKFQLLIVTLLGGLLLLTNNCLAGMETNQNNLTGPFSTGASYTTQDKKYADPNWATFVSKSVQNTVSLRVLDKVLISSAFTYIAALQIQYYTAPGASVTTVNTSLTVNYVPGQGAVYKGLDTYTVPTAYKIMVTVTGSTTTGTVPAGSVQLGTDIVIDRQYPFVAAKVIAPAYSIANNNKQLLVNWNRLASADEYDVEWTTINNGNINFALIASHVGVASPADSLALQGALLQVFRNNASRITTADSSVSLSMLSTDSLLLVRIRQVQYDPATGIRVAGNWDYKKGTAYAIWQLLWNEQSQNWQYSAAFAEGGKKKEVISYFDGTLRGRQTVSLNNTDNVAVAQENVYDYFGRPSASILPAPYKEPSLQPYLHYLPAFNRNPANTPYTFANVAGTIAVACELNPDSLKTTAGASRYYSGQNDFINLSLANKYIPDAERFPLSVTQYTNDNTGRIKSQGGVGLAFQPGKSGSAFLNKTTKYYYGKPEQWELDQLFANDAGYAEHYLKNMVVDPNGQISISYLNASGKTVATALTGKVPVMVDSLPSYHPVSGTTKPQNIHILKPEQFIYNSSDLTLNASSTYLASVTGTDTLKFDIQKLISHYPGTFPICSNCYYKMTVKVSNDCGDAVAGISTPVKIGDSVSTCTDTATYRGTLTVPASQIGEYHVNIQFAFDNKIIETYADTFITQGISNLYIEDQFGYIKKRYLDSINVAGCYSDCHTCTALLGTSANFVQALKTQCASLGLDSAGVAGAPFSAWAGGLYTALKFKCDSMQTTCSYAPCDAIRKVMQTDVSPGGQYALFDSAGNALEPAINVLTEIWPGHSAQNWREVFPVLSPTDPVYKSNQIALPDGTFTSPNDVTFNQQSLIAYWQPAWALSFLKYHPEYCKLRACDTVSAYKSWDMRVQLDFNKASDVPSIPTGGAPMSYSYTNASDWLLAGDPFFKTGGQGNAYIDSMRTDLVNYSRKVLGITLQSTKGLMAFMDYVLYCQDKTGSTNTGTPADSTWSACTPNNSCRVADREWQTYRQFYFQQKQKYYDLLQTAKCGGTGSCPIGQPISSALPGACPSNTDFSVQVYSGTSTCPGQQTIIVLHGAGALTHMAIVKLYYAPAYDNPAYPHTLVFNAGDAQQTFCLPASVPVSAVSVSSVDCGGGTGYGNDPSFKVVVNDVVGGTIGDSCGNTYTSDVHTTTIKLTDALGNPVTAFAPIDMVIKYVYYFCGFSTKFTNVLFTIPYGESTSDPLVYVGSVPCELDCIPNYKALYCVVSLTNASQVAGLDTCKGYSYTNPQPPADPCPVAYKSKIPRFPAYTSTYAQLSPTTDTTALKAGMLAAIKAQATDLCTGNANAWIKALQPGLTAIGATPLQVSQLTAALIAVCTAGGDQAHPMGASTLPAGASGTYANFGAAIKTILLGGGNFTGQLNPWLIDSPYPYEVQQQSVPKTISNTSASLCTLLAALNAKAVLAGQTLYNYLVSTYGSTMTLSSADVDVLKKSCDNCRFILDTDITLPVFLDPGAKGCSTRSEFNTAKTTLSAAFGGTLSTSDPNYPVIFANYMNQQWGFSLTYYDYTAFDSSSAISLCNTLPYHAVTPDPYDCVKNAVSTAVNSGLADYAAYIALQRQKFRTDYINTCKLAKANANLIALQQEYHYTLYQYDQADNLVRTIPPEGVALVDPGLFSYIDRARDIDTAAYTWTYNGPTSNSSLNTALLALSATLSGSVGAVEMWLYNGGQHKYHWVESTPDRKYVFQVGIAGSTLNIDVYPSSETTGPMGHLLPLTGHYQANISGLLPLLPFTHLVFQGNNLGAGSDLPQVYLNGHVVTVNTAGTPAPFGFTITAGASAITYPDSTGHLKHLRLYNHLLSTGTITANAGNQFFNAADLTYTGWYRFNTPAIGAPPTTINSTTSDETTIINTYPSHGLLTTYAYNSTNQVNKQKSPDGGINRFWYDLLSRLVISQNDKQNPGNNYSYTTYDALGRITQVGQKNQTAVTLGSPDYLASGTINTFNGAGTNSQVTATYYDQPVPTVSGHTDGIATLPGQSNLRKRVAASTYTETQGAAALRATYYNYDLDGNVKTLWQQVDGLYVNSTNAGLKQVDYEYDLVSGKVNFVRYQDGQPDAFYYSYNYDADNRLTEARSSTAALVDTLTGSYLTPALRKRDASYAYYLHGPLSRLTLGNDSATVQGVDYAYTLQGWLKGVNSIPGTAAADIGQDGADLTHKTARDTYGYSLGYYTNDYKPIGGSSMPAFALKYTSATGDITGQSLYNGNISNSTLAISQFNSGAPVGYTYRYDQLNRLKKTRQHSGISGSSWNRSSITLNYQENANYDGNGNILTYGRNGAAPTTQTIDSLTYNYTRNGSGQLLNNKLNYITDAIANSNYSGDLTNQPTNNYAYDAIGNLTQDMQAGITGITWSVYGKINTITKATGNISYTYNPAGQRVSKTAAAITTYYIRDAQGNTLALYDNAHSQINWKEQQLYGSSRLGMWTPNVNLATANARLVWDTTGRKQYELSNHLGNVLATITDKRVQHSTSGSLDYYNADLSTAQDYYPFGMLQPGRQYNAANYRYGFNGKENDNDVGKGIGNQQDYGMRIYDPRVGRFLSVDPLEESFPWNSSYAYAENDPISSIDLDGLEKVNSNWFIAGLQGITNGVKGFIKDSGTGIKSLTTKQTYESVKNNASDMVAAYTGKPGGGARTAAFYTKASRKLSSAIVSTVENVTVKPINFALTMNTRSASDNAYQMGYPVGYNAIPFALSEFGGEMMASYSTTIKTENILFSQQSVNELSEIVSSMRSRGWAGPPIDVIELEGGKFGTLDNTRVLAAHEAGVDVQAIVHKQGDLLTSAEAERFETKKGGTPKTWGDAYKNRIGKQNAAYRKAHPNGSYTTSGNN